MAEPGETGAPAGPEVAGLVEPRALALERFAIRTREGSVTLAGWRLTVASAAGHGAIVLVELAPGSAVHRGEGVFLGWPQERLASAYAALLPGDPEPPFETAQLG
ncbi:MAG TPA: hypothetical protein VGG65_08850 [Thermoanaerobaculia bacterium]|jgi:hypothetical protein